MTTKYKSKNALTTWWEQASRNARIGATIGGSLGSLLLLAGIGFGVKSLFTVEGKNQTQVADTTVKLPEKGIEASDIPSTFATPEIPPLVLPTPTNTPEPNPSALGDALGTEGGYGNEPIYGTDPGSTYPGQINPGSTYPGQANPGSTYPGQVNPGSTYPGQINPGQAYPGQPSQFDALAAQVRPLCGVTEIATSTTGAPLLRSYQQWGKGEFASLLPCLDAMVTIPKDAGIDIEVMVKDQDADAGYLMLRAEDVRKLGLEDKATREQQLRKLFQVSPGRQVK